MDAAGTPQLGTRASPNHLHADGIEKAFNHSGRTELVLRGVSLRVAEGSFVSILGPSGCGKSTLLKILAGLLPPTRGTVSIGGSSAEHALRQRQIGLLFQEAVLLPWLDTVANAALLYEIAIGRRRRSDARGRARELLAAVGLSGAGQKKPSELSGGMKQRVAIARALAFDPSVLLMDEPFGALDAITRDQMNNMLLKLWQETGKTIVFVTHSISEAVYLSDEIHVMAAGPGRIIESVCIDLPRPRGPETFEHPNFGRFERHLRTLLVPKDDGNERT